MDDDNWDARWKHDLWSIHEISCWFTGATASDDPDVARKQVTSEDAPKPTKELYRRLKDACIAHILQHVYLGGWYGHIRVTPKNAVGWLTRNGYVIPEGLLRLQKPQRLPETEGQQTAEWKLRVLARATKIWIGLQTGHASPSKHSIAPDLAQWCVDNGICTERGLLPTAAYIERHVLSGWTPPKRSRKGAKA